MSDGVRATLVLMLLVVGVSSGIVYLAMQAQTPILPEPTHVPISPWPTERPTEPISEPTAMPTSKPPTPTANSGQQSAPANAYEVGGIDFGDPERKIMVVLDPSGINLQIRYFQSYPITGVYDFDGYGFGSYRDVSNTWLTDEAMPVVVLHSGLYRGSALTMWDFQKYLEVNEDGNRDSPEYIKQQASGLIGTTAVVIQGDCSVDDCIASLFKIDDIVRVAPEDVDESQQHLVRDFEPYHGLDLDNGFVIRTCGRQALGDTFVSTRSPWQQSRYNIAFEFIGGPIDFEQYVDGGFDG